MKNNRYQSLLTKPQEKSIFVGLITNFMKRILLPLLAALAILPSCGKKPLLLTENNIPKIVAALTDEEKCHLLVGANHQNPDDSTAMLDIAAYKDMIPGCAGFTFPISRLGIPSVVFADGPAGPRIASHRDGEEKTYYCTAFPIGSLLSSTWDPALVEEICAAIGNEVLEYGVDVLLGPGVNLHRNPLCGRNFEYYSEDPLLSGKIAAAYVRGVQSQGVGTSVKHFAANNQEINRLSNDARVSVTALRELYLKNFETVFRESEPWTVMTSYNYLNGTYTAEHKELLRDVLLEEWGYKGLVITDWGDSCDPVAMIEAGNPYLAPGTQAQYDTVLTALRSGRLSRKAVDEGVAKVLGLVVKSPRFKGYVPSNDPDLAAHAQIAREAATQGMVLLENRNAALPLKKGATLALFGSNTWKLEAGGTGAGDVNTSGTVNLYDGLQEAGFAFEPVAEKAYSAFVETEKARTAPINEWMGWWFGRVSYEELPTKTLEAILPASAKGADAAVITLLRQAGEGKDRLAEPGDFELTEAERQLLEKVCTAFHAAGKQVVVVLNTGGVMETASWKDLPDAILLAWQPGQLAGPAIADVLDGTVNPSGHLPMSWPVRYADVPSQTFPQVHVPQRKNASWWHHKKGQRFYEQENIDWTDYLEDRYVGYRYYTSFDCPVSYPFGFGKSYTTFAWSDLKVTPAKDGWTVDVTVTNTGDVPGRDVVQLYSKPCETEQNVPVCELRAFAKTSLLESGASETVSLCLTPADLAHFCEACSAWITPAGTYGLVVARDADSPELEASVEVRKEMVRKVADVLHPSQPEGRPLYLGGGSAITR